MKFAPDALPKDLPREQYCFCDIVRCLRYYMFRAVWFCGMAWDLFQFCKSSVSYLGCWNVSFSHQYSNVIRYLGLRQEGTDEDDFMFAAVQTVDGNVVVAGYTLGSWDETSDGWRAIAAAKLNANDGEVIWKYQVG